MLKQIHKYGQKKRRKITQNVVANSGDLWSSFIKNSAIFYLNKKLNGHLNSRFLTVEAPKTGRVAMLSKQGLYPGVRGSDSPVFFQAYL